MGALRASASHNTHKTTVERSARSVPRRFVIYPRQAKLAVNQIQRFEVTDVAGNPVPVRWNLSGLGCDHVACGEIDDQGVYHPPFPLPPRRVVVLEGVVIADPRYSVLAEIHLETAEDIANSAAAAHHALEVPPPPSLGRVGNPHHVGTLPLPSVVPGPPQAPERELASRTEPVSLRQPVGPPPVLEARSVAPSPQLPMARVVPAPPSVRREHLTSEAVLAIPQAVGAAPAIPNLTSVRLIPPPAESEVLARQHAEMPTSVRVVPPPPPVERGAFPLLATLPLPAVIGAQPTLPMLGGQHSVQLFPLSSVTENAPPVEKENLSPPASITEVPRAVRPAPVVEVVEFSLVTGLLPLPSLGRLPVSVSPALPPKPEDVPFYAGHTLNLGSETMSRLSTQATTFTPAASSPLPQGGTEVKYRDGLLTVDARGATLADVLQMIAKRTGAVIDIPPGSGTERIVEHAGPGPARDVLAHLLDGSSFNFVIVSPAESPEDLGEVLLSVQTIDRSMSAGAPPAPSASSVLWTPPDQTLSLAVLPAYQDTSLTSPKREDMTPQAISEFMRSKFKELQEKGQQQYPH